MAETWANLQDKIDTALAAQLDGGAVKSVQKGDARTEYHDLTDLLKAKATIDSAAIAESNGTVTFAKFDRMA